MGERITDPSPFQRPAMELAPYLAGKLLCRRTGDTVQKLRITETEAYLGETDTAAHARHGRTPRTEPLYQAGGTMYVYLCYGIHWLLNIAAGTAGDPQCVLIRACQGFEGPGRLTKQLCIDKRFNGQSILDHGEIWLEDDGEAFSLRTLPRVGIAFASPEDVERPCRFVIRGK